MPDVRDIQVYLGHMVERAIRDAIASGELPDVPIPPVVVERPKDTANGDFASTAAMRMARAAMKPPVEIARAIARRLAADDVLHAPEVVPPGFINLRLHESFLQRQVLHVIQHGPAFANIAIGAGKKAQVEFVSANPTGPLHVGNGRGAALGDALANVLTAAGYATEREYYVNDAGTQTDTFADTLYARYQQLFGREVGIPSDGYPGAYMVDLAKSIEATHGDSLLRAEGDATPEEIRDLGMRLMVAEIRSSLERLGVRYEEWFSERSLYGESGSFAKAMSVLREQGYLVEREGATWFSSSELGESKDNVVVRSNGKPTYYASDIAYHYNKFIQRGFDIVIDIWGADHHGHVSRLKTATTAVGADADALHILLYQLVTLKRGGETVRLSKRGGEIITLDELIEEVGADATRFFFLLRSPGAQMEFDIDLAVKQSNDNPVYYVQYAHARLAQILARAREQGVDESSGDVSLLMLPHELALIREMMRLVDVIETSATTLEVQSLPHYAMALATAFHAFNDAFRQQNDSGLKVITDDVGLTRARLQLVRAAKIALARVLDLMGVSAPERM